MLPDLFTVIAQIVNFLVLVGLLKYFLFDRITKAMDEREQTIAAALEQADETRKLAQEQAERYQRMNDRLEESRRQTLDEVRNEAGFLRKALFQSARTEVEESKLAWQDSLEREKKEFLVDLRRSVCEQVLAIARRALSDLAGADLEERMVHVFADRLRNMSLEDLAVMRDALQNGESELTVETAFEVSEAHKKEILASLHSKLSKNFRVRFETPASKVCGIELRFHGNKIGWSIDSYLGGLEKTISSTLGERVRQDSRSSSEVKEVGLEPLNKSQPPQDEHIAEAQDNVGKETRTEERERK